jgi:hypothetical protein
LAQIIKGSLSTESGYRSQNTCASTVSLNLENSGGRDAN